MPNIKDEAVIKLLSVPEPNISILKLWKMPSFEPITAWIIFYKHRMYLHPQHPLRQPYVRQILTQMHFVDGEYIPDHNISVSEAKIDESVLQEAISGISEIKVPLLGVQFPHGNDGVFYGMEALGNGFGSVRLCWWGKGPNEWQPILKWYNHLVSHIVSVIKT